MSRDEMLHFTGPMNISVKSGRLEILLKEFSAGSRVIVHRLRNYVARALDETELDITMGEEAKIQRVDEDEPYLERVGIAEDLLNNKYGKVVLLGGVDTGKSTLSILISNMALKRGHKPAVIDGDVGQADIGPPGFISMSYPEEPVLWMRELKPVYMKFVGDIKPQHRVEDIIHNLYELIEIAAGDQRAPIIVDTDGWIGDEYALSYKYKLISELDPDAIVVLGEELWNLFSKFEAIGVKVYRTRTPASRRVRSREERRQLRRDKYSEYLNGAGQRRIDLDRVVFLGHFLLQSPETLSVPVSDGFDPALLRSVLYLTKSFSTLHVAVSGSVSDEQIEALKKAVGCEKARLYSESSLRRLYVAVSDKYADYPGLIEQIDFKSRTVTIKTQYSGEIKFVKLSNIRLLEDYSEQVV